MTRIRPRPPRGPCGHCAGTGQCDQVCCTTHAMVGMAGGRQVRLSGLCAVCRGTGNATSGPRGT